jgi:hypothetical protein
VHRRGEGGAALIDRTLMVHTALAAAVLAVIAVVAPIPAFPTDKNIYEQMSRQWFIQDCDDLQCFRVAVPWTLGLVPGDGYAKWRTYAVVCEALAGGAMALWVLRLDASRRAARQVLWLTALGSGALFAVHDPFTSDPLMHLLAPALMVLLVDRRVAAAIAVSMAAVLAKEFAAVPLAVMGIARAFERRFADTRQLLLGAALVVATWAAWNLYVRAAFNYSMTGSASSATLWSGGYLWYWYSHIGKMLAAITLAGAFGGLWLLWPVGVARGPLFLRYLTAAGLVPLAAFVYLQQPERALWNFAFLVMPAAAVVFERIPQALGWLLVATQAAIGLRMGAQLSVVPPARLTLALSAGLALTAIWYSRTNHGRAAA